MILRAHAKINLGLDIIGRRSDGYHLVRMVMQTVGLYDHLELTRSTSGNDVILQTNLPYIPKDSSNLAVKAAELLKSEFSLNDGLLIRLKKRIPVSAGLAGGSADAAAVLIGVNRLYGLNLTKKELMRFGEKIGADVPFCILQGTALAEGIGEKLTLLNPMPVCTILIAKPDFGVSTKKVYSLFDEEKNISHPDIDGLIQSLENKNLMSVAALSKNALEPVTARLHPEIALLEKVMLKYEALQAVMSGSGPSVYGLFESEKSARLAKAEIVKSMPVRQIFITSPYNSRGDL